MATDVQTITTMILLFGGIIFVTGMFIYRKLADGETFDLQKYGQTFGYVALVAVAAYLATGALPDFFAILNQIYTEGIPNIEGILALATSVMLVLINKIFKISAAKTQDAQIASGAVAAPPAVVPATGTGTGSVPVPNQKIGKATFAGLYAHSAASGIPVKDLTMDINLAAFVTFFSDMVTTQTGVIALKIAIDGKTLTKWTPDNDYPTGTRATNLMVVGEKQPIAFRFPGNPQESGTHKVQILTGYFTTDKKTVFDEMFEFSITFTGKLLDSTT